MAQKRKYDRKTTIYLNDKLYCLLDEMADRKGTRVSNLIREILINYLEG